MQSRPHPVAPACPSAPPSPRRPQGRQCDTQGHPTCPWHGAAPGNAGDDRAHPGHDFSTVHLRFRACVIAQSSAWDLLGHSVIPSWPPLPSKILRMACQIPDQRPNKGEGRVVAPFTTIWLPGLWHRRIANWPVPFPGSFPTNGLQNRETMGERVHRRAHFPAQTFPSSAPLLDDNQISQ